MFDVGACLDELRCRPTGWLAARRDELVRIEREAYVERLAVTRVLDERGALDESLASRDGVSERTVRETVETARALESLPAVAAAAHAGALSAEQLGPVTRLADEASDGEWAARGAHSAPGELSRLARCQRTPTVEESRARYEARHLRMWWHAGRGMLAFRGELSDIDGARFEAVIGRMVERMRPPDGRSWDSWEHRAADALVELCANYEHVDFTSTSRAKPLLVVQVPAEGPATIAGIPLADELVESLRASAEIEPELVDGAGVARARGRRASSLSAKIVRAVHLRDGARCQAFGCGRGGHLEVHHLVPRSRGGSDEISNLVLVCVSHHRMLEPHGRWRLTGNPNLPGGLKLRRIRGPSAA